MVLDYNLNNNWDILNGLEKRDKLEVLINQCKERNIPYEVLSGDEARTQEPEFWNDVEKAQKLQTNLKRLQKKVDNFRQRTTYLIEYINLF